MLQYEQSDTQGNGTQPSFAPLFIQLFYILFAQLHYNLSPSYGYARARLTPRTNGAWAILPKNNAATAIRHSTRKIGAAHPLWCVSVRPLAVEPAAGLAPQGV